jgi:CRP-like cAMP-binding protein
MLSELKLPGRCRDCPLRGLTVYGSDGAEHAAQIEALRRRCTTFSARRILCYEGDAPTEVFQLFDGWAFRYKVTRDGRRQILSFVLPGDLIDLPLLNVERTSHAVKALTPISVCVFNRSELADFIYADPQRARRAGSISAAQGAEAEEHLLDLGQRPAFERIARLLGHLAAQLRKRGLAEGGGCRLPLTQAHIADATGLTAVHVGRTLREMRRSNLLNLAQGWLTIHDPERLRAI